MKSEMLSIVKLALKEDIGTGDITTNAIIPASLRAGGYIRVKQRGLIAGLPVSETVFRCVDRSLKLKRLVKEGSIVRSGTPVLEIRGKARSILAAERTALNFLGRLSGIATLTHRFGRRIADTGVKIMDTRKTTPGLRALERYAVKAGGGFNHRCGLYDAVLIKDNHIGLALTGIAEQVRQARLKLPGKIKIEVEVGNLSEFVEALKGKPNIIMLDNMKVSEMRKAVKIAKKVNPVRKKLSNGVKPSPLLEASGRVNLANVRRIANTGVDRISIGSLTHSAPSLDVGLEIRVE